MTTMVLMDEMQGRETIEPELKARRWVTTTLYDLMWELQAAALPGEEDSVVEYIVHGIRTGRIRAGFQVQPQSKRASTCTPGTRLE